jgi:hypothetical protein
MKLHPSHFLSSKKERKKKGKKKKKQEEEKQEEENLKPLKSLKAAAPTDIVPAIENLARIPFL